MLDFMTIGLPRSGTTWVANFFCTERTLCFHDPLYTTHYQDWDTELPKRTQEWAEVGVSCTGIWRWTDWLNQHPAHKVLLHRDLGEVAVYYRDTYHDTAGIDFLRKAGIYIEQVDILPE